MNKENKLSGSTNIDYHANRTHLSSSTLKLLLKDAAKFYDEWFLGYKPQEDAEKPQFTEGSFTHTLILEPHKVATEYAVFEGLRKSGAAFEAFKAQNPGKTILSAAQVLRCEALHKAYSATKTAVDLVQNGFAEHTLLSEILNVPVKMRADYIVPGKYIVDVKTTSGISDKEVFRASIDAYGYALSAALYCQIAYANFGMLHDFYFIVLSKADGGCRVYKASSELLSKGAADVTAAIVKYKKCAASGEWRDDSAVAEWMQEIEEV